MDKRTADLGTASIGPLLLRLSIPGMVSMVVMSMYNIIDTMWVSGLPNGTEAIATLSGQVLGAGLAAGYLLNARSSYRISLPDLRLKLAILGHIARVGVPSFLNGCLRSTVGSVFNWVLAGFGPAAIAAQGLSMRVMMLMLSFMGPGVSQALVPIVGFNYGAKDYRRMWRAWLTSSSWLSGIGVVLASIIILFAPTILAPLAREADMLRLAVWAARMKVCTIFLVEPQMMGVFTFQGMGMGFRALVLTMTRGVVFVIPAVIVLARVFGVHGVFVAQPVADVLGLLIAGTMLWRTYRRYPVTASASQ